MAYNENPSYLPLNGGTMTGNLILNADPSTNLQAATKQYVDTHSGGNVTGPGSSIANNFASFADTTGQLLSDSGVSAATFLTVANNLSDVATPLTAFTNISPQTTKGDLIGFTTVPVRIPVGTDTYNLVSDSTQASGVKWAPPSGGGITEFFSAYLSAPTGNVTGDNTLYGPIIFDGIISNSSSSYNPATGIYTAPSTGQYCFQQTVCMVGGDSLTQEYLSFWGGSSFSARAFQLFPTPGAGTEIFSASIFCHLTMGDTVSVSVLVGGTNKNILIYGAAPTGFATTSLFSGFKVA